MEKNNENLKTEYVCNQCKCELYVVVEKLGRIPGFDCLYVQPVSIFRALLLYQI